MSEPPVLTTNTEESPIEMIEIPLLMRESPSQSLVNSIAVENEEGSHLPESRFSRACKAPAYLSDFVCDSVRLLRGFFGTYFEQNR